jgi:hypothetical protein
MKSSLYVVNHEKLIAILNDVIKLAPTVKETQLILFKDRVSAHKQKSFWRRIFTERPKFTDWLGFPECDECRRADEADFMEERAKKLLLRTKLTDRILLNEDDVRVVEWPSKVLEWKKEDHA